VRWQNKKDKQEKGRIRIRKKKSAADELTANSGMC
jgi:hypothetical protein